LKLLVIAADALIPNYIFDKRELFPNIKRLINKGASSEISSYAQRCYTGSFTSSQNWASIYTGLPPHEHKINIKKKSNEYCHPKMNEFKNLLPIWDIFNSNKYSMGMVQPACCIKPVPIDGFCVTSTYSPIFSPSENREAKRHIQVCEKDSWILKLISDKPPPRVYPKTLGQLGYSFEELRINPDLVDKMYSMYNFEEVIASFKNELDFCYMLIQKVKLEKSVDILWFYTPSTDIIPHFVLYEDDSKVLIECYKLLDSFIGKLLSDYSPQNVVIMSDHGQSNFKDLVKCSNQKVQREVFSKTDDAIWLNNGYIALEATNGGLLLTTHTLKGVFIACGKNIKNIEIADMRTLDIYPTLLEMLDIIVPEGRSGFVVDIFNKPLLNASLVLKEKIVKYKNIALIQTHEINIIDIIINELYIEKRFSLITIVGDQKYKEIFQNNPRVFNFVPIDMFNADNYEEVFCGFYNSKTGLIKHIKVK